MSSLLYCELGVLLPSAWGVLQTGIFSLGQLLVKIPTFVPISILHPHEGQLRQNLATPFGTWDKRLIYRRDWPARRICISWNVGLTTTTTIIIIITEMTYIYGAVILAKPLREFTRFTGWMQTQRRGGRQPSDQANRLGLQAASPPERNGSYRPHPPSPFYYYSARELILVLPSHNLGHWVLYRPNNI